MMPNVAPVIAAATLFIQSYNQSTECYRQGIQSDIFSKTLGSYYADSNFVGFWNGMSVGNQNQSLITAITKQSIETFEKSGIGYNIHIRSFRIEPYAEDGAGIFVDWNLKPKNGMKDQQWTTLYGYRMKNSMNATLYQDMKSKCAPEGSLACSKFGKDKTQGWFEFTITDNEIKTFSALIPNYLASYAPPS